MNMSKIDVSNVIPMFPDEHPQPEGVFLNDSATETLQLAAPLAKKQLTVVLEGFAHADRFDVHWTAEFPENLAYNGLVHFINGFGATEASSGAYREASAQAGFATVTHEPVRKDNGRLVTRVRDPQRVHAQSMVAVAADLRQRSDIRKKAPNGSKIERDRKILKPHSMGGLAAAQYAELEPDVVEMIYNYATCGFGPPTIAQVLRNLPSGAIGTLQHEIIPAIWNGNIRLSLRSAKKEAEYFLSDVSRPICEGRSCVNESVLERTERLRARGVLIAWLGFEYDFLVPPTPDIAKYVDLYRVMRGAGHMAPQRKPQEVINQQFLPAYQGLLTAA